MIGLPYHIDYNQDQVFNDAFRKRIGEDLKWELVTRINELGCRQLNRLFNSRVIDSLYTVNRQKGENK